MSKQLILICLFQISTISIFADQIATGLFQDYLEVWRYASYENGEWKYQTMILNQKTEILHLDLYKSVYKEVDGDLLEDEDSRRKLTNISILPMSFALIQSYIDKRPKKRAVSYLSLLENGENLVGLLPITTSDPPPPTLRFAEGYYYSNEALNGKKLPFWYRIKPFDNAEGMETVLCYQDESTLKQASIQTTAGNYRLTLYPNSNVASYGVDWTSSHVNLVEDDRTIYLDFPYKLTKEEDRSNAHTAQLNLVAVSQPMRPYITFPLLLEHFKKNITRNSDQEASPTRLEQTWVRIPVRFR